MENYGVDPDIEIEYSPDDYRNERDPQLDLAIDILLKENAKNIKKFPDELTG